MSDAALSFGIAGVGLLGPGLNDWAGGRALLADPGRHVAAPTVLPAPERLPATERRRAGAVVKASIAVAEQAIAMAAADASTLATVFTSSTGDPANCHAMCEALATPERAVSPTRFTNSVHNVAAGTWHIAARSRAPSTSLAAHDDSFSAGLLEAALQCVSSKHPVLLVACDLPYPEPLHRLRPLPDVFGCALLLTPDAAPWRATLTRAEPDRPPSTCRGDAFEALRRTIPAAHALPLLQTLAQPLPDGGARLVIAAQPGLGFTLEVRPA
jgi:hypothetical protein